jgi:hypothetical protein
MNKKAQQEIVGFVLIVVLVVIGLMVFLTISLRDSKETEDDFRVINLLDALMKHTTECAIVYEPDYDNFEELFKSCHKGDNCNNLGIPACEYLNDSLKEVLDAMIASEATINAYDIEIFVKDEPGLIKISQGNQTGSLSGAQKITMSGSDPLTIRMRTWA